MKQQRISLFWLFGSGEVVHLCHSCTDKHIPKRSIQCRGKTDSNVGCSSITPALAPKDVPTSFLLFTFSTVLPKSILQVSSLVSDTNCLNTYLLWIPFLAILFRLAFKPTLSTTAESEHDGSCQERNTRGWHLFTRSANNAKPTAFSQVWLVVFWSNSGLETRPETAWLLLGTANSANFPRFDLELPWLSSTSTRAVTVPRKHRRAGAGPQLRWAGEPARANTGRDLQVLHISKRRTNSYFTAKSAQLKPISKADW